MSCLPCTRISVVALLLAGGAAGAELPQLAPGKPVSGEISGLQTRTHTIAMRAGQFVAMTLHYRDVDFSARLLAPDGSVADEFPPVSRANPGEVAEFVAGATGAYRLEIRAPFRGTAGRYEIRLADLRPATAQDRRRQEARNLGQESSHLQQQGEYSQAIETGARALEVAEREWEPRDPAAARFLADLGRSYHSRALYDRAEPLLKRALDIYEQTLGRRHPQFVSTMRSLGVTYRSAGEYREAEPLLREALETTEKTLGRDHPAVVICLVDFAYLHYMQGDLSRAEEELKRAIHISEAALESDDRALLHALNNLAVLYNARHEYDRAQPLLDRVIAAEEKSFGPEHSDLAMPLWNLALIAQERDKNYGRALELYGRAEALLAKSVGPGHWQIGAVLNNVANVYKSMGDYPKALELHTRVHVMWEQSLGPYHKNTVTSLGNLARTYTGMGDVANAVKYQALTDEAIEKNLALNLAIGSERQKLAYLDSLADRADRTISLQVKMAPNHATAIRLGALAALRRKGRVLDAMSLNLSTLSRRLNPADRQLLDRWNSASTRLATLALGGPKLLSPVAYKQRLAEYADLRDRAEAEAIRRSAEIGAHYQPVTLEAITAAIPRQAALIEFATWRPFDPGQANELAYGEPRFIVYVLRPQAPVRWKDLGPAREIDRAVDAFRRSLQDPQRTDIATAARALDRKVMEPVRALIGDAAQLLISPDGSLNLIPFQALLDERNRYLVERYSISYLTSGRDLLRMRFARPSRGGTVIFADPLFGDSPELSATRGASALYFAPLTATAAEARALQSLFPDAHLFTARDATKAALKAVDAPRILHIATHGFFQESGAKSAGNPLLRSGLALAGANDRQAAAGNGILTALEASGLNLWGTRLVTLSACSTGIGDIKNGEGVYGLRRAFILAGAQTLVMSLWPVSDYVTRETMLAFYTGLSRGLGRGEALRQAQLALLRREGRRHPYYWAPFIQMGEWANLNGRR